jgi:hypothetical protein
VAHSTDSLPAGCPDWSCDGLFHFGRFTSEKNVQEFIRSIYVPRDSEPKFSHFNHEQRSFILDKFSSSTSLVNLDLIMWNIPLGINMSRLENNSCSHISQWCHRSHKWKTNNIKLCIKTSEFNNICTARCYYLARTWVCNIRNGLKPLSTHTHTHTHTTGPTMRPFFQNKDRREREREKKMPGEVISSLKESPPSPRGREAESGPNSAT